MFRGTKPAIFRDRYLKPTMANVPRFPTISSPRACQRCMGCPCPCQRCRRKASTQRLFLFLFFFPTFFLPAKSGGRGGNKHQRRLCTPNLDETLIHHLVFICLFCLLTCGLSQIYSKNFNHITNWTIPGCLQSKPAGFIHACMHAYIHPSIYPSIHPSIHACIHTYIHTYIDTR